MDLQNPSGNIHKKFFIDYQGFTGIDYFSMLRIKDVTHMIKDNNLVTNQESLLGAIQNRRLQGLVGQTKDCHRRVLAIISAACTEANMKNFTTHINIEYLSGGDFKLEYHGKVETWHKWTAQDVDQDNYIGSMVGVLDITLDYVTRHNMKFGWTADNKHDSLKYQAIYIGPAWEANKWPSTPISRPVAQMAKAGYGSRRLMCRRMAYIQLQTYARVMRATMKSISVFHGQRKTSTTIILRANTYSNLRISQLYYKTILIS